MPRGIALSSVDLHDQSLRALLSQETLSLRAGIAIAHHDYISPFSIRQLSEYFFSAMKRCGLITLETTMLRGDQTEVVKILNGPRHLYLRQQQKATSFQLA